MTVFRFFLPKLKSGLHGSVDLAGLKCMCGESSSGDRCARLQASICMLPECQHEGGRYKSVSTLSNCNIA
jgi:hypothetical protein